MNDQQTPKDDRHAVVIGAGIVGTCCALYLQRAGLAVTLIDRDGPGEAASFGNAGALGLASVPPLGMPDTLWKAPKMILDPMHPLTLRWGHLPKALPWFLHFTLASLRSRAEAIADVRADLLGRVNDSYAPLLDDAGAKDLIHNAGLLMVFESDRSRAEVEYALEMRRRRGVKIEELSGDEAREMEPALGPLIKRGVFFPQVSQSVSPLRLTQTLAQHFQNRGGMLRRETVKGFDFGPDGPKGVVTDTGQHDADIMVLAAGVWSKFLARQLGTRVLLEAERGYHTVLPNPGVDIRVPLVSEDRHVTFGPMEDGLRLTSMAEFAAIEAAPDYARAERIFAAARELIPGLDAEGATEWVGSRPSTPDSIPVIGPSPRFANVLFAFGHGHLGLTLAAVTGRIVADLAQERRPETDLNPLRPDRF